MANTLLVYKGEEVIKRQPKAGTGKTTVTIEGLSSNTEYTKGTYKLAWSNGATESAKVDVPAFTTNKIGVTTVTATPATTSITVGNTQQISSEVEPTNADDKTLIYTSNNEPVATVDDSGLITAVKAGNATITVKSNDNATATAKVSVTVEEAVVNVTGVTVDPATLSLETGETERLNGSIVPSNATNKSSSWSSSNEEVATIANSTVTAVGAGTATITLTSVDGEHTGTCEVTVTDPVVNVTGVTLDATTATMNIDDTKQLSSTVAPANATDKTVTYASKAQGVASVDNKGLITAKSAGTAQIVATTKDGAKTATCDVTVENAVVNVTNVGLTPATATLDIGATQQLTPTVEPSNASYKAVSFTSSDDAIATVDDDGLVTAVAAGSADITVESIADGSKTATSSITVNAAEVTDPPAE